MKHFVRKHEREKDAERNSAFYTGVQRVYFDPACTACKEIGEGNFGPPHQANPNCLSGKREHCSCDFCF